jgi:predicted AAA+ superfamily ATPase
MYARRLAAPSRSFFLFGPRATGKTTWLRATFPRARYVDLPRTDARFRYIRDPSLLRKEIEAAPSEWVVIDEIQLVPPLLDEVQALMDTRRAKFALSGSSARKLKGGGANLLGGRAMVRNMFPFTVAEIKSPKRVEDLFEVGTLPLVVTSPEDREDLLASYALTYLNEEIKAEALARDLGAFTRFLECAALANGQVTNLSAISRDAGVQRSTVQGYLQILEDTLLGHWLPAYRPRARIKEVAHPKFYWFDAGVARAMARRIREPVERAERGPLLETFVFHELRAFAHDARLAGTLSRSSRCLVRFTTSTCAASTGSSWAASRAPGRGPWTPHGPRICATSAGAPRCPSSSSSGAGRTRSRQAGCSTDERGTRCRRCPPCPRVAVARRRSRWCRDRC